MNLAGKLYLDFVCAENYPEQEPAHEFAKWYDLLWLIMPILGLLLFVAAIESRHQREGG